MRRIMLFLITVALLPFAITTTAVAGVEPDAPDRATPARKKVVQRHKEWMRLTFDVKRHRRQIVNRELRTSVRHYQMARAGRANGVYACVINTRGKKVLAYPVLRTYAVGRSFSHRWTLHVYRVDKARRLTSGLTQQFEMCAVGGGHTWNKWASDFNGAATTLANWTDVKIGQDWGERVTDGGGIMSSLGFKLSAGFAEVSAALPVGIDDDHRFTGTGGADPRIELPYGWDAVNRVNAYYQSGDDWTFQGTDRFVGNTLQVLYEVPQRGTRPLRWIMSTKIAAHCTKWFQVLGRRCEAFD